MTTSTTVAKWGNAPAIRIPKRILEQAKLHEGAAVSFEVESPGVIIVRAVKQRLSLHELVAAITSKNVHSETEWGRPRGHETW